MTSVVLLSSCRTALALGRAGQVEITLQFPKSSFPDGTFSVGMEMQATSKAEQAVIKDSTVDSLTMEDLEAAKREWKGGYITNENGSEVLTLTQKKPETA